MASAAQSLRPSGICFCASVENTNFGRNSSRIFPGAEGAVSYGRCRHICSGHGRELSPGCMRWAALVWSPRRSRRKRRIHLGSWHCLHDMVQQELKDGRTGYLKSRSMANDVTENGRRPAHGIRDSEPGLQDDREEVLVASEVGTSGRPRKSRSSARMNGSSGSDGRKVTRKKKQSSKTAPDEDDITTKAGGFLSDYSESEVGTDVDVSDDEVPTFLTGSDAEAGSTQDSAVSSSIGSRSTTVRGNKGNGDARHSSGSKGEVFPGEEIDLRFMFLEAVMERARNSDVEGVEEAMLEMQIAGIKAGPRAYHGLVVGYARVGDTESALQALRRTFGAGAKPLPETFVALARLFGSKGQPQRGEEILAAMEKLDHDPRVAWLILVEELFRAGWLKEANEIFLKGARGGLRATNDVYDMLVEENCRRDDHANAIDILRFMEYGGRMCTTFHYNCLLLAQANAGVPDIAAMTFESMQYGRDEMKPDTESYNWLIQAHTRHKFGDRCQEVIDVLGEMVEDHKRVLPNMKTYALLIECFAKYDHVNEAVRHFRALVKTPCSMRFLYNEGHGRETDPLSLYLRAICLEGRAVELLDALEAMIRDNQPITRRAMLVNRKGRTLVSSWIEPIQQEADLGYEVDYVARYIAEGGLTGTRKRWSSSEDGKKPVDPDNDGFSYAAPVEVSYKGFLTQMRRRYNLRLIRKLKLEGVSALGPGATETDVTRVIERLVRETLGDSSFQVKKPKAASKMLVSELKEELDAQGLPIEGTRPVLYQRVQKARRINRARGRPLWVPMSEEEAEERNDEELDVFMGRLNLKNENTEFWRKRFTGEDLSKDQDDEVALARDALDADGDDTFLDDDDDEDEEDVEVEDEGEDMVEDGGEVEEKEPPEMLAMQLLKNKADMPEEKVEKELERREGEWLGLTLEEKLAFLREEKRLDVSELYTIADVWGWTWERELREREPEMWSQEKEVQLGIDIMHKVQALGGVPTIADCAILIRAAMRTPWPEAMISLLQDSHKLGYVFGSKLYTQAVSLCLSLGEKDAAINIITDMEEAGVAAPEDLLTEVLQETQDEELR